MVRLIRQTELALGSAEKKPLASEVENRQKLRKSVVTKTKIEKGQKLTADMLAIKRPGTGIQPADFYKVIGKTARRDIGSDQVLSPEDIEGWR